MIAAKLEWARIGDSARQLRDVVKVLKVQGGFGSGSKSRDGWRLSALEAVWAEARGLGNVSWDDLFLRVRAFQCQTIPTQVEHSP
jgi:hypothetical protein